MTSHIRPLLLFALASLFAIAFGAAVMMQGDIPPGVWIRNPIAWAIAAGLAFLLVRTRKPWPWMAPIALAVIALSLLGPAQEGVHRWLGAGPILFNAAALVLPAAIAAFPRASAPLAILSFTAIAAILAWQPDISQLAGFAPAAIILAAARFGLKGALASIALAAAAVALCLTRPDPLEPVAHVEGIFLMAWSQSPIIAIAMAASLAAAALSPLLFWKPLGWTAPALSAYLAATAAAPVFGPYPVPLAGYGVSFILGWWLGLAALCVRQPPNSPPHRATAATP